MLVDFNTVVGWVINIALLILGLAIAAGAVFIIVQWQKKSKRYKEYKCIIFYKDGLGNIHQKYDNAGIFTHDITRNKRLYMKRANVGLPPDNIPVVEDGNVKRIYMFQKGLKNFLFLKPNLTDEQMRFEVGEDDVNWASDTYEGIKRKHGQQTLLQYMPFILLALTVFGIVIIFHLLFKKLDVIVEFITIAKEMVVEFAKAQAGQIV